MADLFSKLWEGGLTQDSFGSLMKWLNPDPEEAEKLYLKLREKTIRYFQSQGCLESELCADLTFSRVSQKILAGTQIQAQDQYVYIRGVARFVLMEYWRTKEEPTKSLDELLPTKHPSVNPKTVDKDRVEELRQEQMLKCLDLCLQQLPNESREIFIEYHQDEKRAKIDHRILLAQKLGIDLTVLRNRITRIRARLEKCINSCLEQQKD